MLGQAVADCCNAGVICASGDLSLPNVLNRWHTVGFGWPRQFKSCCLRKSTVTRVRCKRALSSWNTKFPPMRWANGTTTGRKKFDKRNVGRLSYVKPSADRKRTHDLAYVQLRANYEQYKKSFLPRTIREWNSLPPDLVHAASVGEFIARLQNYTF